MNDSSFIGNGGNFTFPDKANEKRELLMRGHSLIARFRSCTETGFKTFLKFDRSGIRSNALRNNARAPVCRRRLFVGMEKIRHRSDIKRRDQKQDLNCVCLNPQVDCR